MLRQKEQVPGQKIIIIPEQAEEDTVDTSYRRLLLVNLETSFYILKVSDD